MGTRILELDTIQYPGSSTAEIQVGSGTVTIPSGVNVDINGGNIDGTTIGASSTAAGSFTTISGTLANGVTATTQASSDNSTKVATTAYVKSVATLEDLDIAGDSGTGSVDLDSQSLTVAGTTNEVETSVSGQTVTIGLPSTISSNTSGNAATATTATALATGRTIAMTGEVTYTSPSFDGSGNVTAASTIANNAVTKAKIPSGYTFVKDDYVESTSGGGGAWIGGGPFSLLKNPYTGGYQYTLPANTTTYITCGGGNMIVGEVNDTSSSQPDRRGYGGTQMLSYGTSSGSYSTNIMGNNAKVRSHTSTTYENADGYYLPAPPFVTKIVNSTNADVSYYFQYRYMPVTSVTYGGFFAYNPWSFQQTQALSGGGTFSLLDTRVYIKFETYQD